MAMEEIFGHQGVNAILNSASQSSLIDNYPPDNLELQFSFSTVSRIQSALEEAYGTCAGHGLALRVGRACFKYWLRDFGSLSGLTDKSIHHLPLSSKLQAGLTSFADIFNRFSDQRVLLDEDPGQLYWQIERCPLCWERQSEHPVCHLAIGLLQETIYWVSDGKIFNVEETECIARGNPACIITIGKVPLE